MINFTETMNLCESFKLKHEENTRVIKGLGGEKGVGPQPTVFIVYS